MFPFFLSEIYYLSWLKQWIAAKTMDRGRNIYISDK